MFRRVLRSMSLALILTMVGIVGIKSIGAAQTREEIAFIQRYQVYHLDVRHKIAYPLRFPFEATTQDVFWSPDGDHIALTLSRASDGVDFLELYQVDTGTWRQLAVDAYPKGWMADDRLMFQYNRIDSPVYAMNLQTQELVPILYRLYLSLRLSPDATRLLFSNFSNNGGLIWYIITLESGEIAPLFSSANLNSDADWMPITNGVVYAQGGLSGTFVYMQKFDGTFLGPWSDERIGQFALSPDETYFAYIGTSDERRSTSALWLMAGDLSAPVRLLTIDVRFFVWSPDSETIYFVDDHRFGLNRIRVSDGYIETILNHPIDGGIFPRPLA